MYNNIDEAPENKLELYYYKHADKIEEDWATHISEGEWGSGEDKIVISDRMFWEFVEEHLDHYAFEHCRILEQEEL